MDEIQSLEELPLESNDKRQEYIPSKKDLEKRPSAIDDIENEYKALISNGTSEITVKQVDLENQQ